MSYAVDDEECYAVYDETCRRARKEHTCDACKETIRRGDVYHVIAMVYDGSASRVKRCLCCQQIHEHLRTLAPGEVWPDERLGCGLHYKEEWGDDPPLEIQAIVFMTSDELQAAFKAKMVAKQRSAEASS